MFERSTIIMVLLAIVAVGAAVFVSRSDRASTAGDAEAHPLLEPDEFDPERVTRITLERRGESPLTYERSGQAWSQVAPFAHPMDPYSIGQLARIAASLQVVETLPPETVDERGSIDALGLAPPEAILTFERDDARTTIELGRRGIAGRAYLRLAGDEAVFVVSHDLHDRAIAMDPKEWRDRTLFQSAPGEPVRIEMHAAGDAWGIERDGRTWRMIEPAKSRVESASIDALLAAIGRSKSSGFVLDQPTDLNAFGLANPAGILMVIYEAGPTGADDAASELNSQRLLIGSPVSAGSEDRFAIIEGRPTVLHLTAPVLGALFPGKERLVAHTATGVAPADVKSLRISGPEGEFRLERDLARWIAPDHRGKEVPRERVDELLAALAELRATSVRFAKFPEDRSVGHITLHGFDGRPRDTVRIARDGPTGNWALENGDNVLRLHPASLSLPLTPGDFGLQPATP